MKIEIKSTRKTITFKSGDVVVRARVWKGKTDTGIPVEAHLIRAKTTTRSRKLRAAFEREYEKL